MTGVAVTADDITPAWLSSALGLPVARVTTARVGTGQMGATYRLAIAYDGDAPGPERLVAKLAAADPQARMRVAEGYRKEVQFYSHIQPTVDVRAPRCWYVAISEDATTFTLLLDDLAPATPGVQANGCAVPTALNAVRNVAGLHAPRWNDSTLLGIDFLSMFNAESASLIGTVLGDATESFVKRFDGARAAEDVETLRDAAAATAGWLTARPEPFALLHGDYRLDNLMFSPDGHTVTALDWQTLSVGPPLRDVAYFLGNSLETEMRRAHEADIVRAYREELLRRGVTGYDATQCFDDYRLGQMHGPLITVLGCEYATGTRHAQSNQMFIVMARRSCAAIRDLESLELVR